MQRIIKYQQEPVIPLDKIDDHACIGLIDTDGQKQFIAQVDAGIFQVYGVCPTETNEPNRLNSLKYQGIRACVSHEISSDKKVYLFSNQKELLE